MLHYVNIVFGILLIIIGILIFTQTLSLIANLPELNGFLLGSWKTMEKRTLALIGALILIAAAIVLLSSLSPNRFYTGTAVAPGNRTAINAEKAKLYPLRKGDCRTVRVCER